MAATDELEGGLRFLGQLTLVLSPGGPPAWVPFQTLAPSDKEVLTEASHWTWRRSPSPPAGSLLLPALLVWNLPSLFHSGALSAFGVRRGPPAPSAGDSKGTCGLTLAPTPSVIGVGWGSKPLFHF